MHSHLIRGKCTIFVYYFFKLRDMKCNIKLEILQNGLYFAYMQAIIHVLNVCIQAITQ